MSRQIAPLEVDGDRPAVAWVTALPAAWTTPRERLVLLMLALDTYSRKPPFSCEPRMAWLASWTGEHRQRISEAVASLSSETAVRPALLRPVKGRGRGGNRYVLLTEASAVPDGSRAEVSGELSVEGSAERSATADDIPIPCPPPSSDSLRSSASTLPRRRPIDEGIDPKSECPEERRDAVDWYLRQLGLDPAEVSEHQADRLVEDSSMHPKAIANTLAIDIRPILSRPVGVEVGPVADPWTRQAAQ